MNATLTTLFVKQFYRMNTGFFLVCFFVLFGIINFHDMVYFHYSIMERAGEPYVMGLLMSIWLLYAFKCFSFGYAELQIPTNSFLYQLQGLGDAKQLSLFSCLQTLMYLPALVYAILTTGVLFAKGNIVAGSLIILYQGALIVIAALLYRARLNSTYKQSSIAKLFQKLSFAQGEKKFRYWLLHYLAQHRKGALFGIKTGSLILLQVMVSYNANNLNFESVCFLMMGLIGAHAILPYYLREFTETQLSFVRAMPLGLPQRFTWYLLTYAVLLLPELAFLLLHVKSALPVVMIFVIYLASVAQLSLYSSLLYLPNMTVEKYMLFVACLFFISILLLAAFPIGWFVAATFIVSFLLFILFYERWEMKIGQA